MTAQVLQTYELLDLIFGYLDWRTSLRVQSVARSWHEVVQTGSSVQYKLGFKSIERKQYWILTWNSLNMFIDARKGPRDAKMLDNEMIIAYGRPTSVFANFAKPALGGMWSATFGDEYIFSWNSIPSSLLTEDTTASWRRMFITQPPTTTIEVYTVAYYRDSLMFRRIPGHQAAQMICNEEGLTLGQIITLVKKWKAEAPTDIDWNNERFAIKTVHMTNDHTFLQRLNR